VLTAESVADRPPGRLDLVVDRWGARFAGRRFACSLGRAGIGEKRAEGDGITPRGVMRVELVLRRARKAAQAGGGVPARLIGPFDGWSDDPADPAYNRLVPRRGGLGAERLCRADRLYDLVGVLDWNRHPVVPGRGSAIFLHAWRGPRRPTAGCIAFALRDLAWILARWTRRSRVIVR